LVLNLDMRPIRGEAMHHARADHAKYEQCSVPKLNIYKTEKSNPYRKRLDRKTTINFLAKWKHIIQINCRLRNYMDNQLF
jgi:hypothetical protein